MSNLIPILSEDECAPDARENFDKEFLKMMHCTPDQFLKVAVRDPDLDALIYRLGCYVLDYHSDYPYWTLSIATGGGRSLIVTHDHLPRIDEAGGWSCHEDPDEAAMAHRSYVDMGAPSVTTSLVIKSTDYEPFYEA